MVKFIGYAFNAICTGFGGIQAVCSTWLYSTMRVMVLSSGSHQFGVFRLYDVAVKVVRSAFCKRATMYSIETAAAYSASVRDGIKKH